ncbi:LAQU0S01e04632g1_1 [Lachancea quebecensis]|uniref:LAQU0S01e04632g1_1 n=1 Tax=Lachancea quebecensis TaxID=1654605 RepID=A0A0P1KKX4_9SACH|nr:LAQU0S01e04632g1_1 [Lachancea quebecensis]
MDKSADCSGSMSNHSHIDSGEPIDPRSLDWDGPQDPDNPHNWPTWQKWFATMTAAMLCLVVTMGSSLYVNGVPRMVLEYGYSQTLALAGLTFYLLGLSTVVGAPLSEIFGRKPIYVASLPLSMLFTMGVALSGGKMRVVLPVRFFAGVFASPALSVASGTIVDIFDMDEVSVAMSLFCLAPFLGPVISPVIAGFATEKQGWRWATYIQLFAGGIIMPFVLLMPETHKTVILIKRAKKRNVNLIKPSAKDKKNFLMLTLTITVFRPIKMLLVEPTVLMFSIYVAFIFAVLFAFFEAYPVIFRGVYHMDGGISGLAFIGIGIGLWIGSVFYILYDRRFFFPAAPAGTPALNSTESKRTKPYRGKRDPVTGELVPLKPEKLLDICKIGSIALPISLFWLGWTSKASVHWMAPMAAGVPFGFGLILIFFSVIMYFSTCYPPLYVASALAANNLLRYVTSCVFPLFTIQMYEKMTIGWASSLFGFICVAMIPLPWIFEKYGESMRQKSTFGFNALEGEKGDEESCKSISQKRFSHDDDPNFENGGTTGPGVSSQKKEEAGELQANGGSSSVRSHPLSSGESNISQPVLKGSFL